MLESFLDEVRNGPRAVGFNLLMYIKITWGASNFKSGAQVSVFLTSSIHYSDANVHRSHLEKIAMKPKMAPILE